MNNEIQPGAEKKLLLFDTCGAAGSVALAVVDAAGNARLSSCALPPRNFSAAIITAVRELLDAEKISLKDLQALVVQNGPGSFTGTRVGLSAVKGLAHAGGVPVIALSRLAVLASMASGPVERFVAMDAGRGEFYLGRYHGEHGEEWLAMSDDLLQRVGKNPLHLYEELLAQKLGDAVKIVQLPQPTAADSLGPALRAMERGIFADLKTLDANYLRPTDVERTLERNA